MTTMTDKIPYEHELYPRAGRWVETKTFLGIPIEEAIAVLSKYKLDNPDRFFKDK